MSGGTHLTLEEREQLAASKAEGLSLRAIARRLGRAASTISRELHLQRVAPDPGDDAGDEPARPAHLDDGDERAVLPEGDEGPAQVVRLRHGALHRLFRRRWLITLAARPIASEPDRACLEQGERPPAQGRGPHGGRAACRARPSAGRDHARGYAWFLSPRRVRLSQLACDPL